MCPMTPANETENDKDARKIFNSQVKPMFRKSHEPICEKCGKYRPWGKWMEIHHIKPLADGGTNNEKNLVVLCDICHAEYHITDPDFEKWIKTPPGALIEIAMGKDADTACYLIKNWQECKAGITLATMIEGRKVKNHDPGRI